MTRCPSRCSRNPSLISRISLCPGLERFSETWLLTFLLERRKIGWERLNDSFCRPFDGKVVSGNPQPGMLSIAVGLFGVGLKNLYVHCARAFRGFFGVEFYLGSLIDRVKPILYKAASMKEDFSAIDSSNKPKTPISNQFLNFALGHFSSLVFRTRQGPYFLTAIVWLRWWLARPLGRG